MAHLNFDRLVANHQKKNNGGLSLNINDFKQINSQLARVVVTSNTMSATPDALYHGICEKFNQQAAPVVGSFRRLASSPMPAIHGFVARNQEVRPYDKSVASHYRQTASNILMDVEDESLWTMRKTASGTFLVRDVNDEIGELVQMASVIQRKHQHVPVCASIGVPALEVGEIAAFVNPEACELEHGRIIACLNDGSHYEVATLGDSASQVIESELIVHAAHPNGSDREATPQLAAPQNMTDKAALRDYYAKMFQYAPAYFEQFVRSIDALAVL